MARLFFCLVSVLAGVTTVTATALPPRSVVESLDVRDPQRPVIDSIDKRDPQRPVIDELYVRDPQHPVIDELDVRVAAPCH
ncbi:hypothetical protein PMIN04_001298 [Paraphaeosphaeria minitans]